jgi:3-hydroxyisobutyrate dehydrogenase-like beta-hydroxyacid dehydrogenase
VLAERGGIDRRLAAEVMSNSSIGSPMLKARVPLLLDLPEQAWFDVALMQKDIRLAHQAADELATALPSAAVGRRRGRHAHPRQRARLRTPRHRRATRSPRRLTRGVSGPPRHTATD